MKRKQEKPNTYRTSDLCLAGVLAIFYPLEAVEKEAFSNKSIFVFSGNEPLEEMVGKYHRGELRIEPKVFFSQLRILKTRIHG